MFRRIVLGLCSAVAIVAFVLLMIQVIGFLFVIYDQDLVVQRNLAHMIIPTFWTWVGSTALTIIAYFWLPPRPRRSNRHITGISMILLSIAGCANTQPTPHPIMPTETRQPTSSGSCVKNGQQGMTMKDGDCFTERDAEEITREATLNFLREGAK